MARYNTSLEVVADRRIQVARLRLRGLDQREIVRALERLGLRNPKTGEPWSLATVNRDLAYIRDEWRKEALEDMDEHIATMLAEIREVRRRAWANSDLETVLKALRQERDLLGLDAPKRIDVRHELIEKARQFAAEWGLDEAEVLAEAEEILRGN